MKKIILLLIPFAAIIAACSSNKGNDEAVEPKKTIEVDSFFTADRTFADVRGNAKQSVVITTDMELSADTLRPSDDAPTTTLIQKFNADGYITEVSQADTFMDQPVGSSIFNFEFDESGNLVSSSTDYGGRFAVKRNGDGYVTSFTSIGSNGDVDYTKVYTWNGGLLKSQHLAHETHPTDEDGNPIPQPVDKITYEYDDQGYKVSQHEESGDPLLEMIITDTTYDYLDYDERGNWTDRTVNRVAKIYKVVNQAKRVLTDSVSTYQHEHRDIIYY